MNFNEVFNPATQPRGRWYALGDQWYQFGRASIIQRPDRAKGFLYQVKPRTLYEVKLLFKPSFDLTPNPKRVFRIESYDQARKFYEKYAVVVNFGKCTEEGTKTVVSPSREKYLEGDLGFLDWFKASRDFAGIEFDVDLHHEHPKWLAHINDPSVNWMRSNVIRSGCIWNDEALATFEMVTAPRQDLKHWHLLRPKVKGPKEIELTCGQPNISLSKRLLDKGILENFDALVQEGLVIGYVIKNVPGQVALIHQFEDWSIRTIMYKSLIWDRMKEYHVGDLSKFMSRDISPEESKFELDIPMMLLTKVSGYTLGKLMTDAIVAKNEYIREIITYAYDYSLVIHFYPDVADSDPEYKNKLYQFLKSGEIENNRLKSLLNSSQPFLSEMKLWFEHDDSDRYWEIVRGKAGDWY